MKEKYINTEKFSTFLRNRGFDSPSKKILMAKFEGSEQSEDFKLPPNCEGLGRIHQFYRNSGGTDWIPNPLPIDPARNYLGLPSVDEVQVQIFQVSMCSWRCWYCYVDDNLLSANLQKSEFVTVDRLIDLYLSEEVRPQIIVLSGGQPDIIPEWILWFSDEIKRRNLQKDIYIWTDDNLGNDLLWHVLNREEIKRLSSYKNYGRVGCFKGFDEYSFSFNTHAPPEEFEHQFERMNHLVSAEFDVYGYVTFTSDLDDNIPIKISNFVDRLQTKIHPLFPLRVIPLRIFEYTPTKKRIKNPHARALEIQKEVLVAWEEELLKHYTKSELKKPIHNHAIKI